METRPGLLIAFIISLALVAACGQKGQLFLPGSPSEIQSAVQEQQQPAVEESEEDDEDKDEEQTNHIN